jgi:catechol 2,3-dioxygenase-like lactoylglutathione lyase family enzyme
MIEINGMAHVALSVSEWEKCRPFYEALLPFLGMQRVFSGNDTIYHVGGRTAVMVTRCGEAHRAARFDQGGVDLHHLCFRCRSAEDIDRLHAFLLEMGARIVRAPEGGPWAPGYYSVLFEDPAGVRLEANFVPGKGVLAEGATFDPAGDYR